jgi:hypothetical protein
VISLVVDGVESTQLIPLFNVLLVLDGSKNVFLLIRSVVAPEWPMSKPIH